MRTEFGSMFRLAGYGGRHRHRFGQHQPLRRGEQLVLAHDSVLDLPGAAHTLYNYGASTVQVSASQLDRTVVTVNGSVTTCAASFNGGFAAVGTHCQ